MSHQQTYSLNISKYIAKNVADVNYFHIDLDYARYLDLVRLIKTPKIVNIEQFSLLETASASSIYL